MPAGTPPPFRLPCACLLSQQPSVVRYLVLRVSGGNVATSVQLVRRLATLSVPIMRSLLSAARTDPEDPDLRLVMMSRRSDAWGHVYFAEATPRQNLQNILKLHDRLSLS